MNTNPQSITIFDTSLRDGEQSPGCSMSASQKLRFAHALAELGVDVEPSQVITSAMASRTSIQVISSSQTVLTGGSGLGVSAQL